MNRLKFGLGLFLLLNAAWVFGQAQIGISGLVDWQKMEANATVTLDLASAGVRLPGGRPQGETLIAAEYPRLIRPDLLTIPVDSSSIVADLIERGEWSLPELEAFILQARTVPPSLSPDFTNFLGSYSLSLTSLSSTLIRHTRAAEMPRTLNPVSAPTYTGIVIIALETQPIHGMRSMALIQPCLFPKIWDTEMNLIFERNMLNPAAGIMFRYFPQEAIFADVPSGLSPEITAIVGDRPLRIFARGVFGIRPTDPIIGKEDALLIISSEANRNLLREGRVAVIVDDSVLTNPFTNN